MKVGSCLLFLAPLLLVKSALGSHWAEMELPRSAILAIHHEDTNILIESLRGAPKAKLNAALITACRLGKLASVKVLVGLGAEPSFLIERHPAVGEESPLQYAIQSDNLDLLMFLLDCKGALHIRRRNDPLELRTAATTGRVEATARILATLRKSEPSRYQGYLESAILMMVWNKQKDAAISIISRDGADLSDSSLDRLRRAVVAVGGATSLGLLEEVWRAGKHHEGAGGVSP